MRDFRELVLETVEEDLVRGDDGYYVLLPVRYDGSFGPQALRIIADELDRRNEGWHAQVVAYLDAQREEEE